MFYGLWTHFLPIPIKSVNSITRHSPPPFSPTPTSTPLNNHTLRRHTDTLNPCQC